MGLLDGQSSVGPYDGRRKSNSYHGSTRGLSPSRRSSTSKGAYVRPAAGSRSSSSFFGLGGSRGLGGNSSYRRSPRGGYISYLWHKLQRMFKELFAYARRHPMKAFFAVVVPLVSAGGAVHGLMKQFGVQVPGMGGGTRRGGGGYYGSAGYGGGGGGGGWMDNAGSLMSIAKNFISTAGKKDEVRTVLRLRHIALNPRPPPPSIEVILTAGQINQMSRATCERFAQDFNFSFIPVPDYVTYLYHLNDEEEKFRSLGGLHPLALHKMLRTKQRIPAYFLTSILHHRIEQAVWCGDRRFLMAGLGEDMEALMAFSAEIAIPSAVFAFRTEGEEVSDQRAAIEEFYRQILVGVECGEDEFVTYGRLLAAVVERARRK